MKRNANKGVSGMSNYVEMLKKIKAMDEKQLLELFHDIEDIEAVQRIADTAYHFCENYVDPEEEGEHEWVDWKRQDDAQRYADIKSTQDSWK